jgi:manganese/zinc/iron transport system substrate-binding protein
MCLLAAFLVLASACDRTQADPQGPDRKLKVVCTIGMIGDVARSVAGDRADVVTLMGAGVDPHLYKPTRSDMAELMSADVIERRLIEIDPPGATTYSDNASHYRQTLLRLDQYADNVLSSVPIERRVLVTAHDAFNYFGRRYAYEVVGIQGISTESEAGIQDIERIVGLIVERGIPAVFVESTVAERNVRALISGAAARGHHVVIGGTLFSDAMGTEGTYEGTYVGMIDHNVTIIARSLGGEAPERGMDGRLGTGGD